MCLLFTFAWLLRSRRKQGRTHVPTTSCHPDPQRSGCKVDNVRKDLTYCVRPSTVASWHVPANDDTTEREEYSPRNTGQSAVGAADMHVDRWQEGLAAHTDDGGIGVGCYSGWVEC